MAWENRDSIRYDARGGRRCVCVCVIQSNHCCTLIPNNTVPDGSVTRALQGLTTLASELAEKVGIFTFLIVVVGVLTAIGCCIIPCVRGLVQWLTETALLKQMTMEPPPYSDKVIMRRWKAKKEKKKKKSTKLHLRERFCKNQQFIKKKRGELWE